MKIDARSKSVRELLSNTRYELDYYQREYRWEERQVEELLDDLETKFEATYDDGHERGKVQDYPHYFLGSVVMSHRAGQNYVIDGQQRLTTLTLLLIYLNNLQRDREDTVDVRGLIFGEKYGKKAFNLDVPDRVVVVEALYNGETVDGEDESESIRNIELRYLDIVRLFPEWLKDRALPYFVDWLLDNVDLVEITAFSDDDAYTIFETMNDRGLNLTATEMLKGYLLANIELLDDKATANDLWKKRVLEALEIAKEDDTDFLKAWLRAKYAQTIREGKKGATNKDWERIGTSFHKWVKDEKDALGLKVSADYRLFIMERFNGYIGHYLRARRAAEKLTKGFEPLYYNARNNFTLQYPLMLAPIREEDDSETADRKMRAVARFLDIFVARRMVNSRTIAYSSVVYTMFNNLKDIRDLPIEKLVAVLKDKLAQMPETFEGIRELQLSQWSKTYVHHMLARMTRHVEERCGLTTHFENYIAAEGKKGFEIEHIWADKFARHKDEFSNEYEFRDYRNRFGGLLLLPKQFNTSYGDKAYKDKVGPYFGQNLLAQTLNPQCYENNPKFKAYMKESGLPFKAYPAEFKKADLDERQELYNAICEEIWNPALLDAEVN